MHSAAGRLYEVDMRLRPNGKGGFLMTGIDAFERYQHQRRLDLGTSGAAARARGRGRCRTLCRRFEEARRRVLCNAVRRDTLREDVMEMRCGCAASCRSRTPGSSTSSRTRAVSPTSNSWCSIWVLAAAREHPDLVTYSDNIRQLEGLARVGRARCRDGAVAQGSLYRLSYRAASPIAGGRPACGGGGPARTDAGASSRRSGAEPSIPPTI